MAFRPLTAKAPAVLLREAKPLKAILGHAQRLGHLQRLLESQLQPAAREHCHVASWREGSLLLIVTDGHWATRLRYQQKRLQRALQQLDVFVSLNRIQSDRRNDPFSYSSRLVSNLVGVNLSNLAFYGVALETQPTDRTELDFRLSDLHLRNRIAQLPLRTINTIPEDDVRDTRSSHLGQALDINHYWQMFPLAYEGKRVQLNTLTSLSYFRAGSALEIGDDYQLTIGVTLSY